MTILIPQYRTARRASATGLDLLSNLILSLDLEEASGNAIDSSGNGYDFTDINTVGQTTGQTTGYDSRQFAAANSEYFARAGSTTELSIGDNEWAAHMWAYNNASGANTILFACSASNGSIGITASRCFSLAQRSILRNLQFAVGLDPSSSGAVTATSPNGTFQVGQWIPVLIWHDPAKNVIGIKVGSNAKVTTGISTGVRTSTNAVTIGASSLPSGAFNGNIAALRIWRGSGVIAQIVDNTDALDFLNAQQRRHSELT